MDNKLRAVVNGIYVDDGLNNIETLSIYIKEAEKYLELKVLKSNVCLRMKKNTGFYPCKVILEILPIAASQYNYFMNQHS